jgi:hypothetical protein
MKVLDAMMASRDMCAVTCGRCGQADTLERFTTTAVYGTLPQATFQCPSPNCGEAFVRKLLPDRWGGTELKLVTVGAVL